VIQKQKLSALPDPKRPELRDIFWPWQISTTRNSIHQSQETLTQPIEAKSKIKSINLSTRLGISHHYQILKRLTISMNPSTIPNENHYPSEIFHLGKIELLLEYQIFRLIMILKTVLKRPGMNKLTIDYLLLNLKCLNQSSPLSLHKMG
jgi:hypothetical protein